VWLLSIHQSTGLQKTAAVSHQASRREAIQAYTRYLLADPLACDRGKIERIGDRFHVA